MCCSATSAVTHVILGQFKTCVILLGGFVLFGSNPGLTSLFGAVMALGGMSAYTYLNLLDSPSQHVSRISPCQPSLLSKSKLSEESGELHNGNCSFEAV